MSFIKKIFSITRDKNKYKSTLNILGIRFSFFSLKNIANTVNRIEKTVRPDLMEFGASYIWQNEDKISYREKKWFLSNIFYEKTGYYPNWKNPLTFNEKINWLKLNYKNPLQSICVDKYEFKKYIQEKLGNDFTIKVLGIYDDVDEIDFKKLPQKFVIKSTIQGGGRFIKIIKDFSKINIDKLKYELNNYLQVWNSSYYNILANAYEGIKPRIIIEEYMPIRENEALEYKFFCFHGEVKFCLIEMGYFGKNPKRGFYNKDFEELPFSINKNIKKSKLSKKPDKYDEMVNLAEKLSKDFPFVRIDYYVVNNKIYIGEFTFTSGGGFSVIEPKEWDYKMGEWLDLNKLEKEFLITK